VGAITFVKENGKKTTNLPDQKLVKHSFPCQQQGIYDRKRPENRTLRPFPRESDATCQGWQDHPSHRQKWIIMLNNEWFLIFFCLSIPSLIQ
jgi:hypothetical protein